MKNSPSYFELFAAMAVSVLIAVVIIGFALEHLGAEGDIGERIQEIACERVQCYTPTPEAP